MSSDAPAPAQRGRPVWVWALVAACAIVGIGLIVAVSGLFMPSGPAPVASPSPSPAPPSTTAGTPTARTDLDAYGLADPLPFTAPPVWHAEPSAAYRLTAARDELRYISDNGCTLVFRTVALRAARTTAGGIATRTASPGAASSETATQDPETAATLAALDAAIEDIRAASAQAEVTGTGLTVVSTIGSRSGPLVDMAGAALRVTPTAGTVAHARVAVRAVPAAGTAMRMSAECPSPEEAATAMNHASVHAFIAAE